jgi:hypothetical protein
MFTFNFKEALEKSASFPEGDAEVWELLIVWCYGGQLPPLQKPAAHVILTLETAHQCTVLLKLCCMAEKYGMSLVQNLAMDSPVSYLKHSGPGLRLKWDVLKIWTRYTYDNTHESSKVRRFISYFFYHALTVSTLEVNDQANILLYSAGMMHNLASEIPDLNRDIFLLMRHFSHRIETVGRKKLEP